MGLISEVAGHSCAPLGISLTYLLDLLINCELYSVYKPFIRDRLICKYCPLLQVLIFLKTNKYSDMLSHPAYKEKRKGLSDSQISRYRVTFETMVGHGSCWKVGCSEPSNSHSKAISYHQPEAQGQNSLSSNFSKFFLAEGILRSKTNMEQYLVSHHDGQRTSHMTFVSNDRLGGMVWDRVVSVHVTDIASS